MQRTILTGAVLAAVAILPATADAASQRAADIKACKVERASIGKVAFRAAHGSMGACASKRSAERAANVRGRRAGAPVVAPSEAPAPVADASAVEPVAAPPAAESAPAVASAAPAAVAPQSAPAQAGKPSWAGGGNGKAKG